MMQLVAQLIHKPCTLLHSPTDVLQTSFLISTKETAVSIKVLSSLSAKNELEKMSKILFKKKGK